MRIFQVNHPRDELALQGQFDVLRVDLHGNRKADLLIRGGIGPIDDLDRGEDLHPFGLRKRNVRHAEPIDRADQQPDAARRLLRRAELICHSQRDRDPGRGLDLDWLEKTRQWSAPLELPASNRSRWHDALMPVVNRRLLGPAADGQAQDGKQHYGQFAGNSASMMSHPSCQAAELVDHCREFEKGSRLRAVRSNGIHSVPTDRNPLLQRISWPALPAVGARRRSGTARPVRAVGRARGRSRRCARLAEVRSTMRTWLTGSG